MGSLVISGDAMLFYLQVGTIYILYLPVGTLYINKTGVTFFVDTLSTYRYTPGWYLVIEIN